MGLFKSLGKLFGRTTPSTPLSSPPPEPEPEEIQVPQLAPAELKSPSESATCPFWLDVREPYEWNQVRVPSTPQRTVLHIPMNDLPNRLAELPKDASFWSSARTVADHRVWQHGWLNKAIRPTIW